MADDESGGKIGEFINPKSMLTPGICGAVVMMVSNSVTSVFNIDSAPVCGWISLGLSFLLGLMVFAAGSGKMWMRVMLYVFNSLIIFATAAGVNVSGKSATSGPGNGGGANGALGAATGSVSNGPPVTVVTVVQTQYVVRLVTNGVPVSPTISKPPAPVRLTNRVERVEAPLQAATRKPSTFFKSWH